MGLARHRQGRGPGRRLGDEVGSVSNIRPEREDERWRDEERGNLSAGGKKKATFGGKQWIATGLTIVVIVLVSAVVLPSLGNYSDAWTAIQGMSVGWVVAHALFTVAVVLIYPWPFQIAQPGLKYRPAFVIRQTSFMMGNVIPGGGAIGVGVEYEMLGTYGFSSGPSAAAIGISSVSNTLVTLALPVLSLAGLILSWECN